MLLVLIIVVECLTTKERFKVRKEMDASRENGTKIDYSRYTQCCDITITNYNIATNLNYLNVKI